MRAVGVQPVLGRLFAEDEIGADRDNVALLSHAFWVERFGASPSALGSTLTLSGESVEIVGVLPADVDFPFNLGPTELWRPPHIDPSTPESRAWRGWRAIGRYCISKK